MSCHFAFICDLLIDLFRSVFQIREDRLELVFICLLYFTQINDLTIDAEGIGRSSLSDKNSIFNCVFCFKQESTRHQIKQCIFIKVLIHLEAKLIAKTALEQAFRNSVFNDPAGLDLAFSDQSFHTVHGISDTVPYRQSFLIKLRL